MTTATANVINPGDPGYADMRTAMERSEQPRIMLDWAEIGRSYNEAEVGGLIVIDQQVRRLSNLEAVLKNRGLIRNEDYVMLRVRHGEQKKTVLEKRSSKTM